MEESAKGPIVSVRNETVQRQSDFGAHCSTTVLARKHLWTLRSGYAGKGVLHLGCNIEEMDGMGMLAAQTKPLKGLGCAHG